MLTHEVRGQSASKRQVRTWFAGKVRTGTQEVRTETARTRHGRRKWWGRPNLRNCGKNGVMGLEIGRAGENAGPEKDNATLTGSRSGAMLLLLH